MTDQAPAAPVILDGAGQPARKRVEADKRCPRCHAGSEKRVASCGFGTPHPLCGACGWEFTAEVWHG